MKNEECCPVCDAFQEGFDTGFSVGFKEGYKQALRDINQANNSIIAEIDNEDECCCDCGDCC